MLTKFTRIPGFSYILPNKQQYSQELIDEKIDEIKKLGKLNVSSGPTRVTNEIISSAIDKLFACMKTFSEHLEIQRVCCHSLSNLAMEVMVARWIIQKGGFQFIKKALTKFGKEDYKLCWLASSALWNLARPPSNRSIIGESGVKLMMNILERHGDNEKVTNTAIGALSNLSLHDKLKDCVARKGNLRIVMNLLAKYCAHGSRISVMTSGAGLVANLAVSDKYAEQLISEHNATTLLFDLLKSCMHSNQENHGAVNGTLTRNLCAALNNIVSAKGFLSSFLECNGVETVFEFLEVNDNPLYSELLEQVLMQVDVDKDAKTTSLHLCCLHNRLDIIKKMVNNNPLVNLNQIDGKNMSLLDYAISMNHVESVHFLAKCGAVQYQNSHMSEENKKELLQQINSGQTKLQNSKRNVSKAIFESIPQIPKDLSQFMVQFSSNVDILQGNNQF